MRRLLLGILIIAVVAIIIAVLTGFISLRTEGELRAPQVDINATGGTLPQIGVDSKKVVVGTTEATVGAPGIGIEERQVKVPVIGIRDGDEARQNAAQNSAAQNSAVQNSQ
jgi:hypothetical protein